MSSYYQRVFQVCEFYFGEDTKNFLDRQIEAHLLKKSDDLIEADQVNLIKWVRISAGLIIGKDKAEDLAKKLAIL